MALTRPAVSNVWGNAATSSPDMATPTYIDTGFPAPGGVPVKPPRGFINWLFNYVTNGVRYFSARGIADWDATETQYTTGAKVLRQTQIWSLFGTATTGTAPEADLANWQLWVQSPISSTSEGTPIIQWMTARQQRVFGVDPWSFPNGDFIQWDEAWCDINQFAGSLPSYAVRQWQIHGDTGADVLSEPPKYTTGLNNSFRFLKLTRPTVSSGIVSAMLLPQFATAIFTDDVVIELNWKFMMNGLAGRSGVTFVMGFTANSEPINSIADGAFFSLAPGDTDWQVNTAGGGTTATASTAVVGNVNDFHRATLVLVGKNRSGNNTAKALFYIDGVGVQLTTALPYTTGSALPIQPVFGAIGSSGADAVDLLVGPVRYRQNTGPGDVFVP